MSDRKVEQQFFNHVEKTKEIKKPKTSVEVQENEQIQNQLASAEYKSGNTIAEAETKAELSNQKMEVDGSLLGKTKEFLGTQYDRFSGKEEEENHLLKNTGRIAAGIGVGYGLYWGFKKIKGRFSDENEEVSSAKKIGTKDDGKNVTVNVDNTEKKSIWQKAMPWLFGGSAILGAGYLFRDKLKETKIGMWFDDLLYPKLSFETALNVAQGNVMNKANENHMKQDPKLEWNKEAKKLLVFGQEFDLDVDNKKIQGLEIQFTKYEDLIATAIMIGSIKNAFRGKCVNDKPFSLTEMGGDIEIQLSDQAQDAVSGAGIQVGKISGGVVGATLGGLAGAYGLKSLSGTVAGVVGGGVGGSAIGSATLDHNDTLSQICPLLNDEKNKNALIGYLIGMGGWEQGNDKDLTNKAKTDNEKINKTFFDTFKKIETTIDKNDDKNQSLGTERDASIDNYGGHNNIFKLTARGVDSYLKADIDPNNGDIKSVTVEDTGIVFSGANAISEAIHLGSFINKCEKRCAGQGDQAESFAYVDYGIGMIGLGRKGIYFDKDGSMIDDREISDEAVKNNIPSLLEGKNMDTLIGWLNSRKTGGQSLWTNETSSGRTNTFLESLPQEDLTKKNSQSAVKNKIEKPIKKTEQQIIESLQQSLSKTTIHFKGKKIALSGDTVRFNKNSNGNYIIQSEELDQVDHTPIEITQEGIVITKTVQVSGITANLSGNAGSYTITQDIKAGTITIT